MRTRSLTPREKQALETSVGEPYRILWLEGFGNRFRGARLMFTLLPKPTKSTQHHRVECPLQRADRVPDQALGLDPMSLRLMRWVMQNWMRVEFFNTFLAVTLAPRIQMDLLPGIACDAHFVILGHQEPRPIDDYVSAGRAIQRLWLSATKLGLQLQPEMTPLLFARYARDGIRFTEASRSLRLTLDHLLIK